MSKRRLSTDERSLWQGVTRSIAPLPKRRARPVDDIDPSPSPDVKAKPKPKAMPKTLPVPMPVLPRPGARLEPAPAPLGRKARRRLARGADSIDDRLDLHGMTQARAHDALLGFLRRSRGEGAKVVLVITGKGDATGERGVLKRQVPMWLRLPEFRELVAGFETAGIGHGGEGAMYVRVRRARG
jgi:DNA-nicking Smr family endonuclease